MRRSIRSRLALCSLALTSVLAGCEALGFRQPVDVEPPTERTLASGVVVLDLVRGRDPAVRVGDRARLHYVARVQGEEPFDSSEARGRPVTIEVGAGQVVPGWEEGLVGLRIGGRRRLTIPPELAYGGTGLGQVVPPDATLVIEVELIEIVGAEAAD